MAVRPIDANAMLNELRPVNFEAEHSAVLLSDVSRMMREWVERQPALTPPNEWVSVEERRPKYNIREDGELVSSKILCYCETDKTVHLAVSQKFYTARKGEIVHPVFRYYDEWGDEIEDVSHWMPLPAAPDKDNNVLAKTPNEPLTCKGDENGEQ